MMVCTAVQTAATIVKRIYPIRNCQGVQLNARKLVSEPASDFLFPDRYYKTPSNRLICILTLLLITLCSQARDFSMTLYRFDYSSPPRFKNIKLPHEFLIPNSENIRVGGVSLMRNIDYEIIFLDGVIRLKSAPEDTVRIVYEIFPLELRKSYYHRLQPSESRRPDSPDTGPAASAAAPQEESPFDFTRSGSIFRSVTVGSNRDASLESGMDLQLVGRLGKGTKVTAALSDQNIPLQPEGDTRTLQEIDKVYVRVESGRYTLNLGDYQLSVKDREFASVDRKLTGAQISSTGENYGMMISAASSKGEFRSQSITGVEGLQGPYFLTGKRGETGILVLAGTEKVWLDGILRTRGENHDYVIDYSRGELTFTEKNPIDADSRVIIDFQYASGDYSRSLYHSAGKIETFDDKLTVTYAVADESDNNNAPLAVTLNDEGKSALKSAGDQSLGAQLSGAEYAGPLQGDYLLETLSDSTQFYAWAGRDSGDYDVTFSFLGTGLGSYTREFSPAGDIYFEYAGYPYGDYDPVILLPLPRSERIADIGFAYEPIPRLKVGLETAASDRDLNTLSPYDDADNNGYAITAALQADSLRLPGFAGNDQSAGFSLKTRAVDENFHPLDRTEEAEYNRKWGYTDSLSSRERSYDFRSYLIPSQNFRISAGAGTIEKDSFNSSRWDAAADYFAPGLAAAKIFLESIGTDNQGLKGYWRRGTSEAWRKFPLAKPGFCFEGEDRDESGEGYNFTEYRPSLNLGRRDNFLAEHTYRADDLRTDGKLSANSVLNRSHLNYFGDTEYSNYNFDYTHSVRAYETPDSADITSDIGRIEYDTRSENGDIILNFQHRISQSQTAETAVIPIEVGWGEGTHIEENGQYFSDPNGNYLLLTQPTGEYLRSARVKSVVNLRWDARRMKNAASLPPLIRKLSSETYFSVDEESKTDDPWKLYILYLPAFRSDSTLYGSSALRQDLYYNKSDRNFSLRFRFSDNRNLNNRLVSYSERYVRDEYSLRVLKSLSPKTSVQSDLAHSVEKRWLTSLLNRNIVFYTSDNALTYRMSRKLELRTAFKLESARDDVDDLQTLMMTFNPQADYSIFGKGRITVEGGWTRVLSEAESIPYEMTRGYGKGSNYEWGVRAAYQLGKNLNLTLNYDGESKIGRPVIHTGRMELRAFF